MTSLASTLVGALLLWLWLSILGTAIGWICGMWFNPLPWLPSALPHRREDDPAWDEQVVGWWFDDPDPDPGPRWDDPRSLVCRRGPQGQQQVLLTLERVMEPDLQVWEWVVFRDAKLPRVWPK